jgi:hypothetical protein
MNLSMQSLLDEAQNKTAAGLVGPSHLSHDNRLTYQGIDGEETTLNLWEISRAKAEFVLLHVLLLVAAKREGVVPDADLVAEVRSLPEPIPNRIVEAGLLDLEE